MAYETPRPGTLKRKRRRREDKPAISARLYIDSTLGGEEGVLSQDLVDDLYPFLKSRPQTKEIEQQRVHAAVTLWTPRPSPSDSPWTILPFRPQQSSEKPLPPSTIRFPAAASGTQAFVSLAQGINPNRMLRQNAAVEVRICDVVPLALDTVFVSVDAQALDRVEEMSRRYGGANGRTSMKSASESNEDGVRDIKWERRRDVLRQSLEHVQLVHTGDLVPLIRSPQNNQAPPARIVACEPVAQGTLTASTRIVIVPAHEAKRGNAGNRGLLSARLAEESDEDGIDDSAAENFYSATESPVQPSPAKPIVTSKSATDLSNSDATLFDDTTEDSNLSSDEEDMISLAKPSSALGDGPSGLSSAVSSNTQRGAFGSHANGISTPGSVFSHMSSSTIRGSAAAARAKVFRAQGLLQPIPNELLHPRPSADEDEEARVYIDSSALARLGCFSGDWVRLEASEIYPLPHLSAFASLDARSDGNWRPVKVYGLPETMARRPARYQLNPRGQSHQRTNSSGSRRGSISSVLTTSAPLSGLYMSPLLLANLGDCSHVSISPLPKQRSSLKRPMSPRPSSVSANAPSTATEVTLRKIVTPLSSERALNNLLFTNLKNYFERRRRILKSGDLVAIPIDETLGRSVYDGEEGEGATLLSQWSASVAAHDHDFKDNKMTGIVWFTVESVKVAPTDENAVQSPIEAWGGAAAMDTVKTTMKQSGDDRRKLPSATSSTWPYYLGLKPTSTTPFVDYSGSNAPSSLVEPPRPYVSNLQRRLKELMSVAVSPRAVHLGLPPLAVLVTSTQRSVGKAYTVKRTCEDLGLHFFGLDAFDIASEGSGSGADTNTTGLLEARCERALECGPQFTTICIKHIEQLTSDRAAKSLRGVLEDARVLVATTTDVDKISDSVRGLFTHELEMGAPDEGEREGILRDVVSDSGVPISADVDLSNVAVKTAALVAGDLVDVVERAITARKVRLGQMAASENQEQPVTLKDIQLSGGAAANALIPPDFDSAVDLARKNFADSIGAPKIPNVQWSDVGGLSHVKDAVIETIQLPLSRPELFAKGLKKRSGILFYGPPGTGKTLLAKAIATEFSLNFFSVKGPELLNMYIGESEANVRRVFQRARDARPCVVFFDELDSVAPKRGNQGDSGGVMDRIVSQLLAELDGMSDGEEGGGGVFVIGATNRPDLLDQALLRPGRFDKMLYLGISDTHEKQETILRALTRKFTLDPSLSLARVADTLPFTFTGADLYALCSDAMLKAVTRSARLVDDKLAAINAERTSRGQPKASVAYYFDHHAADEDTDVSVVEDDFMQARKELVPSVSVDELRHYERVRATFEGAAKQSDRERDTQSDVARTARGKRPNAPGSRGSVVNGKMSKVRPDQDSDDDFVIRTDKLSMTGGGKGKGKISNQPAYDGDDLYD